MDPRGVSAGGAQALTKVVQAAADATTGEFTVPLAPANVAAMKRVMDQYADQARPPQTLNPKP